MVGILSSLRTIALHLSDSTSIAHTAQRKTRLLLLSSIDLLAFTLNRLERDIQTVRPISSSFALCVMSNYIGISMVNIAFDQTAFLTMPQALEASMSSGLDLHVAESVLTARLEALALLHSAARILVNQEISLLSDVAVADVMASPWTSHR